MSMIQKTIDKLNSITRELGNHYIMSDGDYINIGNTMRDAIDTINQLSVKLKEQNLNNGWITDNNILPDDERFVLIQINGKCGNTIFDNALQLASYYYGGWIVDGYEEIENFELIAWRYLPEGYKGESD